MPFTRVHTRTPHLPVSASTNVLLQDVGFTDMDGDVFNSYFNTFLPRAVSKLHVVDQQTWF